MKEQDRVRLSKFMSLVLRHEPEKFHLQPDSSGFVPLADFVQVIANESRWSHITTNDVRDVVASCEKQRFEIDGSAIRCRYGHSMDTKVNYTPAEPPNILYHGTPRANLSRIKTEGLRSRGRQYVHCSIETDTAQTVGQRHANDVAILTILAHDAWKTGVEFYNPETRIYLADHIPAKFIRFI